MSIRLKLIGYFVLIAIIPSILVAYLSFYKAENAVRQKTFEHLVTTVILKENEIDMWMKESMASLEIIGQFIQSKINELETVSHTESLHEEIEFSINTLQEQHPEFQEIFLVDAMNGEVHLSTNKTRIHQSKTLSPFFIQGKQGTYIQPFFYSQEDDAFSTIISTPLHDYTGKVMLVLAAKIRMNRLQYMMDENSGLGSTGETYLVSKQGFPITSLKYSNSNIRTILRSEGINKCINGITGRGIYNDYRNIPVIGAYQLIPNYGICILAEIDKAEALGSVQMIRRTIGILSILTLVGAILAGLLASLVFTRPIKKLTSVAKSFHEGKFQRNVDRTIMQEKSEIGLLANTMSEMQKELNRVFSENQAVIETMPSALFVVNKEGKIESANRAAQKLLNRSEPELAGSKFTSLFKDGTAIQKLLKNKGGKLKDHTMQVKPKSQESIDVYVSAAKLPPRKGYSGGLIVVVKDISELKKYAEKRINEITPILNQISLGDFGASLNLPRKEDEFTDLIVAINLMTDNLKELISENQEKNLELKATNQKLADSHKTLLSAKEGTEKEKAKVEAILGGIGEGILATNKKGKIIMINAVAKELFGMKTEEVLGKTFMSCKFKDDKGRILKFNSAPITKAIKSMKPVYLTTYHEKISGKNTALATTISPVVHGGKTAGLVATFRDISKEKEVDQAKTEFVSLASHQLRTPLTAIKWIIEELLHNKALNKKQKEYLNDALKSNKRMIGLVNDLLNVSRLETGNVSVTSIKTNVSELINQVLAEAKPLANKKKQRIEFKKPSRQITIDVDPQLLRQIVSNLISNAVKYSDPKTTISVQIQKRKTKAVITVTDQGIGIPKNVQPRVFQKFFRTGEAVKRSTSGSGLGLYIIRKVTDAMHGEITFKSTENVGTTFTVNLPLKGPVKAGDVKKLIEHRVS